jgi:hypothetical protein
MRVWGPFPPDSRNSCQDFRTPGEYDEGVAERSGIQGDDAMRGGEIVGLVAVVCIFGVPMLVWAVSSVMDHWQKVAKHREDVDLKHKLVDAGFSVEEIERVMNAGRGNEPKNKCRDDVSQTHLKVG